MGYEDKECEGCRAFVMHHCNLPFKQELGECPCLNCLIKGICVTDCDNIKAYVGTERREYYGE